VKREEKTEYYVRVQRRKTIKYGTTQHHQHYLTIPAQLSETLKLQPKQPMKCMLNCNGSSLTYTIVAEIPKQNGNRSKMEYTEWLDLVRKFTPMSTWKACEQILREAAARIPPPPIWVRLAENDIGLMRKQDPKTHRTLWSLDPLKTKPPSDKPPQLKDKKLSGIMEFK